MFDSSVVAVIPCDLRRNDSGHNANRSSSCDGAVIASPARNSKVACSRPDAAMLSLGIGSLNHN